LPRTTAKSRAKIRQIDQPTRDPVRAKVIDEFGALATMVAQLRIAEKRYDQLRSIIAGWYEDQPADAAYMEDGSQFVLQVGARPLKRWISDMAAVEQRLGPKRFFELCSISMEKLDSVIAPADQRGLVAEDRIGPRTLKAIPRYTTAVGLS
jgi:hypothetical protein